MMTLNDYSKAKNYCCIVYLGPLREVVDDLLSTREQLETYMPEVKIYMCFRDEFAAVIPDSMVIPASQIKSNRHIFAYLEEIRYDGQIMPSKKIISLFDASS